MTDIITLDPASMRITLRSFQLRPLNLMATGLFDGEMNPYGPLRHRFVSKLNFPPMNEPDWMWWEGMLSGLGGIAGLVRCIDPMRRKPLYNKRTVTSQAFSDGTYFDDGSGFSSDLLPSTCTVDAAALRGADSVILANLLPSITEALTIGDAFEIRPNGLPAEFGHYYRLKRRANTDVSGKTRVYFSPPLRASVAAGDMAVLVDPMTVMRLSDDMVGEVQVDNAWHGRFGLDLTEVLPRL